MEKPAAETTLPLHLCQVLEEEQDELWGRGAERLEWLFAPEHLLLAPLLARLRDPLDGVAARVVERFPAELRARLGGPPEESEEGLATAIADALNQLLDHRDLHRAPFCQELELPEEVRLMAMGRGLEGEDLQRVNRLVLETAFPREVRKIYDLRLASAFRQLPHGSSALCLSGGGIRSAIFSLGIVQGLARHGLLAKLDYLSTVSGGGYLGSLLSAWIHRHPRGIDGVTAELAGRGEVAQLAPEPAPVSYLRSYSNYLSPRLGLLSADTWTLAAIYLGNLYLHWLLFIPLLAFVLLIPRWYSTILRWAPAQPLSAWIHVPTGWTDVPVWQAVFLIASGLLMATAIVYMGRFRPSGGKRSTPAGFLLFCLAPLVNWALELTIFWAWYRQPVPYFHPEGPDQISWLWFLFPPAAINAIGWLVHAVRLWRARRPWPKLNELAWAILSGLFGGVLVRLAAVHLFPNPAADLPLYITTATPLLLGIFLLGDTLFSGLSSQWVEEEDREWKARWTASVMIVMGAWIAISLIVIVGPALLLDLPAVLAPLGGLAGVATAVLARSPRTVQSAAKAEKQDLKSVLVNGALALAAPIFVILLLSALSMGERQVLPLWRDKVLPAVESLLGRNLPDAHLNIKWTHGPPGPHGCVWVPPIPLCLPPEGPEMQTLEDAFDTPGLKDTWTLTIATLLFGFAMARLMDINKFSLHAMYRNRLIRTFLGASREERRPNPFTGFDPADDFEIHRLVTPLFVHRQELRDGGGPLCRRLRRPADPLADRLAEHLSGATRRALAGDEGQPPDPGVVEGVLDDLNRLLRRDFDEGLLAVLDASPQEIRALSGARSDEEGQRIRKSLLVRNLADEIDGSRPLRPFHVVNVALNLVGGKKLAWQQRKAEPFTFTPLHSGSLRVGYRLSRDYARRTERDRAISLGTAVAISGAAASPNMGYHSSPAITFLMAMFNARLGWWLGNPGAAGSDTYNRSHPQSALRPLLAETLGLTDDTNPYIYLSDGGHFENLGLYEMVLRRCSLILAVDAGQDRDCKFEDLGNAIRKIRIDLGIPIDLDTGAIRGGAGVESGKGATGKYCAVGTIRYSCLHPGAADGTLLYLKPTICGIEPRDILHYREQNPAFPHESTGDQWFNEAQLESYRMLGSHAIEAICGAENGKPIIDLADLVACARAHVQGG